MMMFEVSWVGWLESEYATLRLLIRISGAALSGLKSRGTRTDLHKNLECLLTLLMLLILLARAMQWP